MKRPTSKKASRKFDRLRYLAVRAKERMLAGKAADPQAHGPEAAERKQARDEAAEVEEVAGVTPPRPGELAQFPYKLYPTFYLMGDKLKYLESDTIYIDSSPGIYMRSYHAKNQTDRICRSEVHALRAEAPRIDIRRARAYPIGPG